MCRTIHMDDVLAAIADSFDELQSEGRGDDCGRADFLLETLPETLCCKYGVDEDDLALAGIFPADSELATACDGDEDGLRRASPAA